MLLLALLAAQDAALAVASIEPEEADAVEEIVVSATYGRTTMLFDKGGDGKLRNCRIMVSSGSQTRDIQACKATPVCYAGTADEVTDCTMFTTSDVPLTIAPGTGAPQKFDIPVMVTPAAPPPPGQAGPRLAGESDRPSRYRAEKLPPAPSAPKDAPAVSVTLKPANGEQ